MRKNIGFYFDREVVRKERKNKTKNSTEIGKLASKCW